MAIPFYIPDSDDIEVSSPNVSSSQASPSSVPQTPATPQYSPQSDNDYLVQAFCTALHRYSRGGATPSSLTICTSPACTPQTSGHSGDVFIFPRSLSFNDAPPRTPRVRSRLRLTSTGEEIEEDCTNESDEQEHDTMNAIVQRNMNMERENLQEFAGRIPQRKKKKLDHPIHNASSLSLPSSNSLNSRNKDKETPITWPTVVAMVLAVGFGYFAAR